MLWNFIIIVIKNLFSPLCYKLAYGVEIFIYQCYCKIRLYLIFIRKKICLKNLLKLPLMW